MKNFAPFLTTLLLIGCLSACSPQTSESNLHTNLGTYINSVGIAYQESVALWDEVILGNPVGCQRGLPLIASFTLTQSEADQYPIALQIRDALNRSISYLQQSSVIWDSLCANPDGLISPQDANRAYLATKNAGVEWQAARSLYDSWQP